MDTYIVILISVIPCYKNTCYIQYFAFHIVFHISSIMLRFGVFAIRLQQGGASSECHCSYHHCLCHDTKPHQINRSWRLSAVPVGVRSPSQSTNKSKNSWVVQRRKLWNSLMSKLSILLQVSVSLQLKQTVFTLLLVITGWRIILLMD